MADFETDIKFSIANCKKFIYPVLREKYGKNAEIFSLEENKTQLARKLDKVGNDVLVVTDDETFFVNSRCHNYKGFLTFTIRKDRASGILTEYDLIKLNLKNGGIVPKYFAQCYLRGDCADVGIIETIKLFNRIDDRKVAIRKSNAYFYAVEWRYLKNDMETYTVKAKQVRKLK